MPRRVWVAAALAAAFAVAAPGTGHGRVFTARAPAVGAPRAVVAPGVYRTLARTGKARVLVALRERATGRSVASAQVVVARVQRRVLARVGKGFALGRRYRSIPALAGRVDRAGLRRLLTSPDVAAVGPDRRVHADLAQSVPLIGADRVHDAGYTGAGVTVAVLDTGVDLNNPDVADSVTAQGCFITHENGTGGCAGGAKTAIGPGTGGDDEGHGTAVAGIITGNGTGGTAVGVAPGASIVDAKVLAHDGSGYSSDILAGLDWIIDDHPEVNVVNLSLGSDSLFPGTCDQEADGVADASALGFLYDRGVLTFAAAGNDASAKSIEEPACIGVVESVGAVYDAAVGRVGWSECTDPVTAPNQVACFSDASPALDLLAPGAIIDAPQLGGGTGEFDGTSAATPHASGVAALLLQARPDLSPAQLDQVLKQTGLQVLDQRNNRTYPRVDAWAALTDLRNIGPSPGTTLLPDAQVPYGDPTGDVPSGPDIAGVSVASQHGVLGFTVATAAPLATGDVVDIRIDADQNAATGDPSGTDTLLQLDAAGGARLTRWSGGGFSIVRSLSYSKTDAGLLVKVGQSELGIHGDFSFRIVAGKDTAPDSGLWSFPAFPVTVQFVGSGSGRVAGGPIDCRSDPCSAILPHGASLSLTATASPDSVFAGWGGLCSGVTDRQCELQVNAPATVLARFEALRRLTVALQGPGLGTVTSVPAGIDCGARCDAEFATGTSVTLTARAGPGSRFRGWTGACASGGTGGCTVALDKAETVAARFADVARPSARALSSVARPGTRARLRFRLVDNSGSARASIVVERAGRRLATLTRRLGPAKGAVVVSWRVPSGLAAGLGRFCVRPADASGNVGPQSCAALRIE